MRAEKVREKLIEYLRENGSANMTELCREIGCGKQTIYDTVAELESEGKVKSNIKRGRRVVVLVGVIPNYLKTLVIVTFFALLLFAFELNVHPILVNMKTSEGVVVVYPPISVILSSVLAGFWVAVYVLRFDDLYESYLAIKNYLVRIIKTGL